MDHFPLVSVLLPVYNSEKYVAEAINSILNQTYKNFEIIVIDDGSIDNTIKVIQQFKDERIFLFKNQNNLGITKTLNQNIKNCKGKYIARMDADDISLPERLLTQVKFLEENKDYILIGSAYLKENNGINEGVRKHTVGYTKLRCKMLFSNNISHPSVMMNKRLWLDSGELFDEKLRYAQDYDLWTRLILNYKMTNLREPLIIYRRYDGVSNPLKREITNENIKTSQEKYIKSLLKLRDPKLASDLYLLYRRPEQLKFNKALILSFISIKYGIKVKRFNFPLFFLRVLNQLRKTI